MKTFAHINSANEVVGIGMIYFEGGGLTPGVAEYVAQFGEDAGIIAYGNSVKHDAKLTTVLIDTTEMPGGGNMNYDKLFRNAFKHGGGKKVDVDVPKAKLITHDRRRAKRELELAPLDKEINIKIGNTVAVQALEAQRQAIRNKYDVMQTNIDACTTADQLKAIVVTEGI
jgi:hypothetical protein